MASWIKCRVLILIKIFSDYCFIKELDLILVSLFSGISRLEVIMILKVLNVNLDASSSWLRVNKKTLVRPKFRLS